MLQHSLHTRDMVAHTAYTQSQLALISDILEPYMFMFGWHVTDMTVYKWGLCDAAASTN